MNTNDELKDAVSAMYQMALQGCTTREECEAVAKDIRDLIRRLEHIDSEDCYQRAFDLEQAK